MMHGRAVAIGLGLALVACQPDYVHVLVESSTPMLEFGLVGVNISVYGGGAAKETDYRGKFEPGDESTLPYTDFNLVLDDAPPGLVDLRVSVADTPIRWAGDRLIEPPGDGRAIHMLLYEGEQTLGSLRLGGDGELASVARFTSGLATAWLDSNGVQIRTDRVPDAPLGRPELVLPADPGASRVRITSRPTTNFFGPDLLMVTWRGSDNRAWMMLQDEEERRDPQPLRNAEDVWGAVAPAGEIFAISTIIVDGQHLWFRWYDATGALLGEIDRKPPGALRRVRGLVVGQMGFMVAAVETDQGWFLMHVSAEPDVETVDPVPIGEVAAIGLTSDQVFVLVVQRVDDDIVIQPYYATTLGTPSAAAVLADAERVPIGLFSRITVSSCAAAWPERRADGSDAVDIRVQDIDQDGLPVRTTRLINSDYSGIHFAPTVACMAQTVASLPSLAYATFVASDTSGNNASLKLRKLVPAPQP
jgi:hypothetical protein